MTRLAACLLLVLAPLLSGCATLEPNRVTIYAERSQTETDGNRKTRATSTKVGVSATYELR